MRNHEKLTELSEPKRRLLTGIPLFLLGAIASGASAFWSYEKVLHRFGLNFPSHFVLACLIFGALLGMGVTWVADEYDRFRWIAFGAAVLIGAVLPLYIYLILSLLAGPT